MTMEKVENWQFDAKHVPMFAVMFRFLVFQFSTKTAEADTSSELAKKSKETFRKEVRPTLSK